MPSYRFVSTGVLLTDSFKNSVQKQVEEKISLTEAILNQDRSNDFSSVVK